MHLMHTERGCQDGIQPYLLVNKDYLLLSWMLTSFRDHDQSRSLIDPFTLENTAEGGLLWKTPFGMMNTELHVNFVPKFLYFCCILHNLAIKMAVSMSRSSCGK